MPHVQFRHHFPRSVLAKADAWFSSGPYGHTSMVYGGWEYEAVGTGFERHLPGRFGNRDGDVDVVELDDIKGQEAAHILDSWAGIDGHKKRQYNYRGILRFVFPWLKLRQRGLFCSEAAYKLCRELGILPYVKKSSIDPNDFALMLSSLQNSSSQIS